MERRSLFFPLALVAAGVVWLLISMGRMPVENLWALAHFWPFLLIAAGVGLMARAWLPWLRIVVDVIVVAAGLLVVFYAPQLGWNTPQSGWNWQFNGSLPGSGKIVSESRNITGVAAVDISYPAEIVIQQGPNESLLVEGDDNVLPQLRTRLDGDTLYIENSEPLWSARVNPSRPVRITINVKDLHSLGFSGAGTVHAQNLQTDHLAMNVSGAGAVTLENVNIGRIDCQLSGVGNVTISGSADDLKVDLSGVGFFHGADLLSRTAEVQVSGTGSAAVHPKDRLTAEVSGLGSVNYYGNPSITKQVSGLGGVVQGGN
ncbi:MAG TPA: DUF2807 domain-containing protein [Anaerolineales bacterium]|nr:DUF2807 domain-containing protein [Anaerolineales bacterium]